MDPTTWVHIDHFVPHLSVEQVQVGDCMIGTLPLHLAALLQQRGVRYLHLTLTVPEACRGQEISAAQLQACQATVRQCKRYALDPMLGFCHQLTSNRQSLACDLMEPLRPKLEGWLFQLLNNGPLNRRHFSKAKAEGCFLSKEVRLLFYPLFEQQMPMIKRSLAASARWCVGQLKIHHTTALFSEPE